MGIAVHRYLMRMAFKKSRREARTLDHTKRHSVGRFQRSTALDDQVSYRPAFWRRGVILNLLSPVMASPRFSLFRPNPHRRVDPDGIPRSRLAFNLPFGTMYSPNITPYKETGIGNWSDADFLNAVHKGTAPGGMRLYPAFPYAAYTMMTDADALAIKVFLFSLPARHAAVPANTLKFPFNQRWLMAFWSAFFNPDKRFSPDPAQSPQWNRGAYLAEAMAHCGDCHTPRNLMQALDNRRKFSGAVTAGWKAYDITPGQGQRHRRLERRDSG